MSDLVRNRRIHGPSRRLTWKAKARKLRKLDATFQAIMAEIEVDPTKAVMDTRKVLARYLVAFLRNEGLTIPKRKNLFEYWVAARPAFGDRRRVDPEDSISARVEDLLMVLEPVLVSELAHLPNNGFHLSWCGKPKTFHAEEARIIALLGHVAAAFVISIGSDNSNARFMGDGIPILRDPPQDRSKSVAPVVSRPSLTASLSQLLTGLFRRRLTATLPSNAGHESKMAEAMTSGPIPGDEPAGHDPKLDRLDEQDIPF